MWTPAHAGVEMNELADQLAKQGAHAAKTMETPHNVTISEVKSISKSITINNWKKRWKLSTDTHYKSKHPSLPTSLPIHIQAQNIKPSIQKKISRLRMDRTYLGAHKAVYATNTSKSCDTCNKPDDPWHMLLECKLFTDARQSLLDMVELALAIDPATTNISITPETILGLESAATSATNNAILQALVKFLEQTNPSC